MWKNKIAFKNLDLYTTYEIKGINLDRLINALTKRGVFLRDVKKYGNKRLIISVKFYQNENFFAIAEDLCYTDIRKIKDGGKSFPILFFLRNIGLIVGALLFVLIAFFSNDYILDFSYSGSGKVLKREVQNYLDSRGIKKFSRFCDLDLSTLSDDILAYSPRLSFVECERVGNRLSVQLILSNGEEKKLEGDKTQLLSSVDGVVESIKVYRGTVLVGVGDSVKKGDLLVSGIAVVNDIEVKVGVIAFVTLNVNFEYEYVSEKDGEENLSIMFAESALGQKESSASVVKTIRGGKYVYRVTLQYKKVLFTG